MILFTLAWFLTIVYSYNYKYQYKSTLFMHIIHIKEINHSYCIISVQKYSLYAYYKYKGDKSFIFHNLCTKVVSLCILSLKKWQIVHMINIGTKVLSLCILYIQKRSFIYVRTYFMRTYVFLSLQSLSILHPFPL